MINLTLYKREFKRSIKILIIFAAIITMYVSIIISMYDPKLMKTLDDFVKAMPQLMSAVGMKANTTSLLGFMVSYLYGFILLIFPMIFCILRGNGLIAKYTENGAIVSLIAAPVKRRTVACTQIAVLVSGITIINLYITILELVCAAVNFPGVLDISKLLIINLGLFCLHLFIGSICFIFSCFFSDTKYSIGFGAGIPAFMYILQMLANAGGRAENAKYFTFFTLFNPDNMISSSNNSYINIFILLVSAIALYVSSITIFCRKDLYI